LLGKFLTPATTDNVAIAKYFGIWMELNFCEGAELFVRRRVNPNSLVRWFGRSAAA